jgi:hypothetical protein
MTKNFPSDFYVACATIIPVLYLALVIQGGTYEILMKKAENSASEKKLRHKDAALGEAILGIIWIILVVSFFGEVAALVVLKNGSANPDDGTLVLGATIALLAMLFLLPVVRYFQVDSKVRSELSASTKGEEQDQHEGNPDRQAHE